MALTIGSLIVRFGADTRGYEKGAKRVKKETKAVKMEMTGLAKAISGAFAVEGVRRILMMADSFQKLNARMKLATDSQEEFLKVQSNLISISKQTGAELESLVGTFQNIERSKEAVGATTDQILLMVDSLSKLGVVSGASTVDMSNALRQFSQAMSLGVLRGDEFISVQEQMPAVIEQIAIGMGKTSDEMKKLADNGQLLAKDVFAAILKQTDDINKQFATMPRQMDVAATAFKTTLGTALAEMDNLVGATDGVVMLLDKMAEIAEEDLVASLIEIKGAFIDISNRVEFMLDGFISSGEAAGVTKDILNEISDILGFVGEKVLELPVNLRSLFTIMFVEFDILKDTVNILFKEMLISSDRVGNAIQEALTTAANAFRIAMATAMDFVMGNIAHNFAAIADQLESFGLDELAAGMRGIATESTKVLELEKEINAERRATKDINDAEIKAKQDEIDAIRANAEERKSLLRGIAADTIELNNKVNEDFAQKAKEQTAIELEELRKRQDARRKAGEEGTSGTSRTLGTGSTKAALAAAEALSKKIETLVTKNKAAASAMAAAHGAGANEALLNWQAAIDSLLVAQQSAVEQVGKLMLTANEEQKIILNEQLEFLEGEFTDERLRINQELNDALAEQDTEAAKQKLSEFQDSFNQMSNIVSKSFNDIARISRIKRDEELSDFKDNINARTDLSDEQKITLINHAEELASRRTRAEKIAFIASKAIALAQMAIDTARNVLASGGLTPLGIAQGVLGAVAIATSAAVSVQEFNTGRLNGGAVQKDGLHPINENGRSEVLQDNVGNQFLMPAKDGMKVMSNKDLSSTGGSSGMIKVTVVNNLGVQAQVKETMVSREELMIELNRSSQELVTGIAQSISMNVGEVPEAISNSFNVTRSI